ncbi:MAG TPA: hypothetical protein VF796_18430 [Humisphaera sp.]
MSDQHARHCPFLNRSDERCAAHFSLDHLQDAFDHCVTGYVGCPVYRELLLEVRLRRAAAGRELRRLHPGQATAVDRPGRPSPDAGLPIVPLTIATAPRANGHTSA